MKFKITLIGLLITAVNAMGQIGDYRNVFSIGVNGGYALDKIGFMPTVTQNMHGGLTCGLTARYTCEKYFSTLCAIQLEVNMAQMGWEQDIRTIDGNAVTNAETGLSEEYRRDQSYIQIPMLAHLSWGKEKRGVNAFINLGPQIGFNTGETTKKNYSTPNVGGGEEHRVNTVVAQEDMPIENTFDYGIVFGAGIEWHINRIGRFDLEGRYYYGLGNIYGDSKRDYFGASNHSTIYVKLSYLYDL